MTTTLIVALAARLSGMGVALRKAGGGCRVSGISACNIGSGDSGDLPLPSQT